MIRQFFKFIMVVLILFVVLIILTPTTPSATSDFSTDAGSMHSQTPVEKLEAQCQNLPTYADSNTKDLCSLVNRYGAKRAMEMVMEHGKNTY